MSRAREPRTHDGLGQSHQAITEILNEEGRRDRRRPRRLVDEIKNELLGLGPLEPLL